MITDINSEEGERGVRSCIITLPHASCICRSIIYTMSELSHLYLIKAEESSLGQRVSSPMAVTTM